MDKFFLKETFKLAKRGMGWTNPNPLVGTILVKSNKIIGKGYHKKVGFPHAEIEALKSVHQNPKGATLYTNLEPCSHFGKTPPCADAIIKAGVTRVVCSTLDPNPKVSGDGLKILKKSGVDVSKGILEDEAKKLNEAFFTFHTKKRPFIAIKFASSLDGKIATKTGDSKWITNEKARNYARNLRGCYQAVLIGVNTVIRDNPHLGARSKGKKNPIRIILDTRLKIPLSAQVLRDRNVLVVTTALANQQKIKILKMKGISILTFSGRVISIKQLVRLLYRENILSILVEGGSKVLGSFIDEKLVDKVYIFQSPIVIGGDQALTAIAGKGVSKVSQATYLTNILYKKLGDNQLICGYPKFNS